MPDSLARLLSLLSPAFCGPTFETCCWLVCGFVARIGDHTITGVWQAVRLAGVLHHSRAHDFFARRRWSADRLGLLLAQFVVTRLVGADEPLRVVIDDTVFARSGSKVFATAFHYDHDQHGDRRVRWGNLFVCLGILVRLPGSERIVCLPLLARLWRPDDGKDHKTKVAIAHELLACFAAQFPDRRVEVVADGAYANRSLRKLPETVDAIVRLRHNAMIYAPAPAPEPGRRGRPRAKGERIGSPKQLASDPATVWQPVTLPSGASVEAFHLDGLWYPALLSRRIRVVVARDPRHRDRQPLVVLSTDTHLDATAILTRYSERWAIETAFQQAKGQLGVGQARNRVRLAVERTVPFGFICQTLTIIWYALNGNPDTDVQRHRKTAPWYRHKHTASFADMLAALRRELIRAEFRAQQIRRHHQPKIAQPQTPSRAATL
jgi:hypothetical protein